MQWLVLLLLAATPSRGMVINRVFGANGSEVAFASAGGGAHVYLSGTDIGSAFAPPDVFIGINADARCVVQPFTSTKNRLHCIVNAEGLPPPDVHYTAAGRFVEHPLRVVRDGRRARCWHVGGLNHACFVRFDLGATPRIGRLVTPTIQSGGLVRVRGNGVDGGVMGAPGMVGTLYRGDQFIVGVCGEKDCAPSNLGVEVVGCLSRVDGSGDAVAGQDNAVAFAHSDATHFGCQLDQLQGARARHPSPHAPAPPSRALDVLLPPWSSSHASPAPRAPRLPPHCPPPAPTCRARFNRPPLDAAYVYPPFTRIHVYPPFTALHPLDPSRDLDVISTRPRRSDRRLLQLFDPRDRL